MSLPLQTAAAGRTMRVLIELIREHSSGFVLAVCVLALGAAAGVAAPLLLGGVIDAVVGDDAGGVRVLLVVLLAAVTAQALLAGASRIVVTSVGERMLARLRDRLVTHVLRLPQQRVEAAGRGEVISRVSGDVAVVGDTVSSIVPTVAAAGFSILAAAAGLGTIDGRLTLAACVAVPVQWLALRHHLRRSMPVYRAARAASGERAQRMLEVIDARETLMAFGTSTRAEARVDEAAQEARDLAMRSARLGVRFWGRLNLAEFAGLATVLVVGFLLVRSGDVGIGAATAAALMFLNLFGPMGKVVAGFDDLQRAAASLARLVGVLDEETEPIGASPHERSTGLVAVDLREIGFSYGGTTVLAGVTLAVRPGEHVAIVGASGAGKSTLAAIVCGQLSPRRGEVRFVGTGDPRIALVTQDNHVFAGAIADDLRLARPDATDAEMAAALETAGADRWVARLPEGAATKLGPGGVELTDVQRQQLALARVVLFDPDVLVLDEAASEAGSADGEILDLAALRLARGRTTITIAHRLEQARAADRIVVMESGRIVESGSHDELLRAAGDYARLWAAAH